MGLNFSEPIPLLADPGGLLCFVLRSFDRVRLLHAPPNVQAMVQRVVREVSQDEDSGTAEDCLGAVQFRLPGSPFVLNGGRNSATIGKIFAIRIFEEMNAMGYDLVCSTDLSRASDQSTWYFRQVRSTERPRQPVMCVAPGSADKIVIVRGCDYVVQAVKQSLKEEWGYGIQGERKQVVCQEEIYEFKLRGNPWFGEGEESSMCRLLLRDIIGRLGRLKWRLVASTNLKGGTDSLFFIFDENHSMMTKDLSLLSLNRLDRIRLFNFDSEAREIVRLTILRFYQTKEPDVRHYYDALEFKLKGYPFASSGSEAVSTRQLICRLLEALRAKGWEAVTSIDISRKVNDKSVFLFKRCESANLKFACIALSDVDCVRFLNFPPHMSKTLSDIIEKSYLPGIAYESHADASCYEIGLKGQPWTQNSSYNLHGRTMLLLLLRDCLRRGWHLRVSADVSAKYVHTDNGPDYPMDVHSWFFCYTGELGTPDVVSSAMASSAASALSRDATTTPGPVAYTELNVADLEGDVGKSPATPSPPPPLSSPPTYEESSNMAPWGISEKTERR